MSLVAPTLQSFFIERLVNQRRASPRTVASYRDSLKLLVGFVHARTGKTPSTLDWEDLGPETVCAFLHHIETERHNGPRTRNLRLTAIRSLFAYASLRHPEHAALIQRVLVVPPKRFEKPIVSFLTAEQVDALIDAPDRTRWEGRRDRALLLVAVQTGLRNSELTGLNCGDVTFGDGASVRCEGKGRICRMQHMRPYVAARTMSRAGSRSADGGWSWMLQLSTEQALLSVTADERYIVRAGRATLPSLSI